MSDNNQHISTFDWTSFLGYVQTPSGRPGRSPAHSNSELSWYGGLTFDETVSLAYSGWAEGAEKAKTISSPVFDKVSSLIERESIVYDVEGSGLDIGRYLEGEPECWQRWETEIAEGHGTRIIRICFNGTASGGVNSDTIIAKGAVIAALVELLEYSGRRVELTVCYANTDRHSASDTAYIRLKNADQPLDMPRVAFAVAHTSMFRRLAFSYFEHGPVFAKGDLGYPMDISDAASYDLYIGRSQYPNVQWNNPESATAYIISELKRQGISLTEENNE